jgi:hypothetical protein
MMVRDSSREQAAQPATHILRVAQIVGAPDRSQRKFLHDVASFIGIPQPIDEESEDPAMALD